MGTTKKRPPETATNEATAQEMAVAIELMRLGGYRAVVDEALTNARKIMQRIEDVEAE